MMRANEIILKIRDRLRDNDFLNGVKFSDNTIIDTLNDTGREVTRDLHLNITHFSTHLDSQNPHFTLPPAQKPCKLIKVLFNNKEITPTQHTRALDNAGKGEIVFYNPRPCTFSIMPFSDGTLEIYMCIWQRVKNLDSIINMDENLSDLLMYGALMRLFQIENHENNLQRVNFYSQTYKAELQNARATMQALTSPNIYITPFNFY